MRGAEDMFIGSLTPLRNGDVLKGEWPLHVTVVPPYSIPEQHEGAFLNAVTNLSHKLRPVTIYGEGTELFDGEDGPVEVRLVNSIGSLAIVHHKIIDLIERFDGMVDSVWVREKYQPHVTPTSSDSFREGEQRTITQLHRVRLRPGEDRVVSTLPFLKGDGMI